MSIFSSDKDAITKLTNVNKNGGETNLSLSDGRNILFSKKLDLNIDKSKYRFIQISGGQIRELPNIQGIPDIVGQVDGAEPNFLKRADGASIEDKLDILFNLYLVKRGARPSFLLESAEFKNNDIDQVMDEIEEIYPEFERTKDPSFYNRYFYHTKPLPKQYPGEDMGSWIGRALGFSCPDENEASDDIKYAINYRIKDPETSFYTEVCREKKPLDKLETFNKIANEVGLEVEGSVKIIVSSAAFLTAIKKKDYKLIEENMDNFEAAFLRGGYLGMAADVVIDQINIWKNKDHMSMKDILNKYYNSFVTIGVLASDQHRIFKYTFFDPGYNEDTFDEVMSDILKKLLNQNRHLKPNQQLLYTVDKLKESGFVIDNEGLKATLFDLK